MRFIKCSCCLGFSDTPRAVSLPTSPSASLPRTQGRERSNAETNRELEILLILKLNTAITRDRAARTLSLSQALFYVADLVSPSSAPTSTGPAHVASTRLWKRGSNFPPMISPPLDLLNTSHDEMSEFRTAYMAIVGGLLSPVWLANMTRVDIAYSASQLARFMTNPGPSHFKAAIRVLIYVRDTADRALVMQPNPHHNLESYVDSNWATKSSCSGGMFFVYGCLFSTGSPRCSDPSRSLAPSRVLWRHAIFLGGGTRDVCARFRCARRRPAVPAPRRTDAGRPAAGKRRLRPGVQHRAPTWPRECAPRRPTSDQTDTFPNLHTPATHKTSPYKPPRDRAPRHKESTKSHQAPPAARPAIHLPAAAGKEGELAGVFGKRSHAKRHLAARET